MIVAFSTTLILVANNGFNTNLAPNRIAFYFLFCSSPPPKVLGLSHFFWGNNLWRLIGETFWICTSSVTSVSGFQLWFQKGLEIRHVWPPKKYFSQLFLGHVLLWKGMKSKNRENEPIGKGDFDISIYPIVNLRCNHSLGLQRTMRWRS